MNIKIQNWGLDPLPTIFLSIFVLLGLYLGLWLLITGIIGALRMLASRKWTSVNGKIIDTEIRYKKDSEGETTYVKVTTYVYEVNGKHYIQNQTYASDSLYMKDFKSMKPSYNRKEVIDGFRKSIKDGKQLDDFTGEEIKIYVNPNKTSIACLNNEFQKEIFVTIFVGLILTGGIFYFLFYVTTKILMS